MIFFLVPLTFTSHTCSVILCMWENCQVLRVHSGPWGLMVVRSPFIFFAIALSSRLFQELHLNTSSHQIKVGYTGPSPLSQSLGTLVFGATPPPSSPGSDLIRLMLTLGCTGGFQRQHVHCTVPWWKLQVNTGCDTLLEKPWDVCTPQWFLWRRKKEKNYVCLSAYLSLCVEAAARDGLEEIYITKHPQVHREISNI